MHLPGITAHPTGETAAGTRITKTPVRANAIAERWIASARRERPDWMLIAGGRHLRLALNEYVDHCNSHRLHRAMHQSPPARDARCQGTLVSRGRRQPGFSRAGG